jgi:Xaa-Pro aminopeptidase
MRLGIAATGLVLLTAGPLQSQIPTADYASRREALLAQIDSGVVLSTGAREPVAHYPAFVQLAGFRYLTGYLDPDAALVLITRAGHRSGILFVPPTDLRGALYSGRTTDPDALARQTGLEVRYVAGLIPVLDSLSDTGLPLYVVGDAVANDFSRRDSLSFGRQLVRGLQARHPVLEVRDGTPLVDRLRARRSPAELALLRQAIAVSDSGHVAALRLVAAGRTEYEVQAIVEYTFRRLGGDRPAYSSIVGSGPNSTSLHYDAGPRVMLNGEVVLMDMASSYAGYAADITRTVPVNGTFTADQRAVYQIVLEAQKAAERTIRPGTPRNVPYDSARAVIVQGLVRLGLIEAPDAVFDAPEGLCPAHPPFRKEGEACPQWYLYSYHGYSHGLGLDVHDPAQFSDVAPYTFQLGDAFTIEPGLYVRAAALEGLPDTPRNRAMIARIGAAVARYRNTGVRIEDDYFVTPAGVERVSQAPREIGEIETAMRSGRNLKP